MRLQSRGSEQGRELSEPTALPFNRAIEVVAPYVKLISESVNSIECGSCNSVIYQPEGNFDQNALKANRIKHYLDSPTCKPTLH